MQYLDNILFAILLVVGFGLFFKGLIEIRRNILLGRPIVRNDRKKERWQTMSRVALGQSKMGKRPIAAFFHVLVYVGFVIINLELIEIIIDGIFGTHRFLSTILGHTLYGYFTATLDLILVELPIVPLPKIFAFRI
jgi:hypothetical protein